MDYAILSIDELQKIVQADPGNGEAVAQLGLALRNAGRQPEAIGYLKEALRRYPVDAAVLANLGTALNESGFPEASLAYFRQSLRFEPRLLETWLGLAFAQLRLQRPLEALATAEQAQALAPQSAATLVTVSQILQFLNRLQEAEACCHIALAMEPDHAAAHFQRGLVLLQMGYYEQGWPEFEWRFAARRTPPRVFNSPQWDGSDSRGKRLLLWTDQGVGDAIQFSRYIPLLNDAGTEVIVECAGDLRQFMLAAGASNVVGNAVDAGGTLDGHIPITSLGGVMETRLETIPLPARIGVAAVESQLHSTKRNRNLRVGLCWQGSRTHPWDMYRSVRARLFAPLAEIDGVDLYSLQSIHGVEQSGDIPSLRPMSDPNAMDMLELARRIATLDLVITVDTAIAHLAATVHVKTWMLCSIASEWRWLSNRDDSPWYPAMKIYRQGEARRWDDVREALKADLLEALYPLK